MTEAPALVLLGRAGDIINSLPIAAHYARLHKQPIPFVIQKQFVPILECTSYCEPVPWEGELYMTVNEAIAWAKKRWSTVYAIQTWGHNYNPGVVEVSFCDEHFRLAKLTGQRGKWPLVFDRRNAKREAALLARYDTQKPIILYSLKGFSSPYRQAELILQELSRFASTCTLIDTHTCHAECLVDLLGLYDVARALITIDTATMHLAPASKVPYIALTVDSKPTWHTTPPLGNVRLNVPYSQTEAKLGEIRATLESLVGQHLPQVAAKAFSGKLVHITDSHWLAESRCQTAIASWVPLYKSRALEGAHLSTILKRDARDVGSKRALPFLRDLFEEGLSHARDEDALLWTNSDTILAPGFIPALLSRLVYCPIVVGRRVDYVSGKAHPGRDVAAFLVSWLKSNWDSVPDLICGAAEIDVWMALAAREAIGRQVEAAKDLLSDLHPVDIPPGAVKHLDHTAPWDLPETRFSEPANIHNVIALRRWTKKHQPAVRYDPQGFVIWT